MTQEEEKKAYEDTKYAEQAIKDLKRELRDKGNSLLEKIDAIIYISIKLKDRLNFIDEGYVQEIIKYYEGE